MGSKLLKVDYKYKGGKRSKYYVVNNEFLTFGTKNKYAYVKKYKGRPSKEMKKWSTVGPITGKTFKSKFNKPKIKKWNWYKIFKKR